MSIRAITGGLMVLGCVAGLALPGIPQRPIAIPKDGTERPADRQAILKVSQDFANAFNGGDAKTLATLWTEQGECHEPNGTLIRGRAAIEQRYAAFFKEYPKVRIEVLPKNVRFPAAELAVEEGLVRQVSSEKELPSTTMYSVVYVKEGGAWKAAISKEWGGVDRLEDLDWLLGEWKLSVKGNEVTLSFAKDPAKPFITGKLTKKEGDKPAVTGTIRLELDPQTKRLRSWHFDDDGGHGQSLWIRDGNRWVLDSVGVLGDGTPTASVNLIGRVAQDAITWRSIDRVAGGKDLPDTPPIRLTRTAQK